MSNAGGLNRIDTTEKKVIAYSKLMKMKDSPTANDGRAARCGSPEEITTPVELRETAQPVGEKKVAACGWVFGMIISDGAHREEGSVEKAQERNTNNL